jgi:hypothetical protein
MNDESNYIYQLYKESIVQDGELDSSGNNWGFYDIWEAYKLGENIFRVNGRKTNSSYIVRPHLDGWKWSLGGDDFYFKSNESVGSGVDAKYHRLDGPAISYSKTFFINGKEYSEKDYWQQPEVLMIKKVKPEDQQTGADLLNI